MKLQFTKMHGAGNDFVVVDGVRAPFKPAPALLARLTDRHRGIGCDQVLVVEPASKPDVDFDYRIYNSDGTESGQCGNGARCLMRFIHDHKLSAKNTLRVRTKTRVIELERLTDGNTRVNMGMPQFEPADIPLNRARREPRYTARLENAVLVVLGAASMGNPHAVLEISDLQQAPVSTLGPEIQRLDDFPQGVNVSFMQIVDAEHIRLRVYERGAGETLACGSGACAAVAVGRIWGKLGASVSVQMPGGELKAEWAGEGQPLYLSGPAETVFQGEIECPT